jgi:hypothetical protein
MMQQYIKLGILFAILTTCGPICAAQQSWLLQNQDGTWRTFAKESEWKNAALKVQPLETAVVTRTKDSVSVVYDVQAESGDWRNVDRYTFKSDGTIAKLERTFVSVSQYIQLIQHFELDATKKLTKRTEAKTSLKTGKPITEAIDQPPIAIAITLNELEFMKKQ